jgi:alanine-synthesizing transaminase
VATVAGDGPALTFALDGLSKSCALPQMKLAWTAVSGPADLRDEALARMELIADSFLSVGTPIQRAAPAILARGRALREPIQARLRANLAALREALDGSTGTVLDAEGGWSAIVRVPATRSEEEWVLSLLEQDRVLVHPGYFFDFPAEAYLVLSLLPDRAVFEEGVRRLRGRLA